MIRYVIALLVMTGSVTASAQNYTLPAWVYDSMTFEVARGRECSALVDGLNFEILALKSVTLSQDKAITLQKDQIQSYAILEGNLKAQNQNQSDLFFIEKSKLKGKIKKKNKTIGVLSLVIAGLVAALTL